MCTVSALTFGRSIVPVRMYFWLLPVPETSRCSSAFCAGSPSSTAVTFGALSFFDQSSHLVWKVSSPASVTVKTALAGSFGSVSAESETKLSVRFPPCRLSSTVVLNSLYAPSVLDLNLLPKASVQAFSSAGLTPST